MAKNINSETISITEICLGMKAKMRYFGKHCLDANGDVMPFNDQMAIVSHFMHNKGFASESPYREKALGLIEDIYEVKTGNELTPEGIANDPAIQYNMFRDLFSVPFMAKENAKFTFIDLFAGIGGFRMAMQNLGGRCVFSSEWDEQAQKTYLANYGEVPFGDITKESTKAFIPDNFDVLCAGFPCQAFSLAGKRLGFEETRGTLFFDVAEILRRKRPKAFFLENVKGLLVHD